jgi:hypothetical protein
VINNYIVEWSNIISHIKIYCMTQSNWWLATWNGFDNYLSFSLLLQVTIESYSSKWKSISNKQTYYNMFTALLALNRSICIDCIMHYLFVLFG